MEPAIWTSGSVPTRKTLTASERRWCFTERPWRIDIVTEISGVAFTEAWVEREGWEMGGLRVPVISKRHLLANKCAVGRPKDLIDAAWLEEHGGE